MPAKTNSEIEWIPVTERLPLSRNDVLVTVRDTEHGETFTSIDSYGWLDREWFNFENDVIAWARLPEPYEVKDGTD